MALLGWIDPEESKGKSQIFLDHYTSERFECRWSAVKIADDKSGIWFRGIGHSVLGVGSRTEKDASRMQYVDDDNNPTVLRLGIAGVRSRDGRHVAMMPHPERCVLRWQCPAPPPTFAGARAANPDVQASPWLRLFQNAYTWASKH